MSCEDEHFDHSHSHSHSHGDGDDHSHIPPIQTSSVQNLREHIDFYQLRALNCQQKDEDLQRVFKANDDKFELSGFVESDADCQLILNIPFNGNVKLYSIIIRSSGESAHCPRTVKLFKNNKTLDFDNIAGSKPVHKLEQPLVGPLDDTEANVDEDTFVEHHLPRSQFQSTYHLTLFIEDNWDDDEDETTKLYYIELRGLFTSPLAKDPVITLYEAAANPADHKNLLQQEIGQSNNVD